MEHPTVKAVLERMSPYGRDQADHFLGSLARDLRGEAGAGIDKNA